MRRRVKRLGCLLWVLTVLVFQTSAQQSTSSYLLTGIIRDSGTSKAVAYATINVTDTAGRDVTSTYSQESGAFKLTIPRAGAYRLTISFVGYKSRETTLAIRNGQSAQDMGVLLLMEGSDNLQEVHVTSHKRLIDQKPGMLVYNAENDATNKGGTAADVLRKAPVLTVDAQGNVSMRGSGNLKILINGKYSGQMARNPADALNMMPADMIKSVEIITTPSAKYDAEGAAGVINIITLKGKGDLSGSLEAGVGNLEQVLNPRTAFSNSKWNINFAGHLHRRITKSAWILDRTSIDGDTATSHLHQSGEADNAAPHGSVDLTVDYAINEVSELSVGVNAWLGKWPESTQASNILTEPDGTITEQYLQDIASKDHSTGANVYLSYNRRFKKAGQQLTLQVQHSPSSDLSDYDAMQTSMGKDLLYRELNNSKTLNKEWTFQADYVHPLNTKGTISFETGAKLILRNVGNRYDVSASDSQDVNKLVQQPDRSDYFKYSQDVVAGYSMLRMTLKNNWFVEGGARVEATYIKGDFTHSGTGFDNRFVNFIPTATISKKLDESNTFTLSYTKRLTRPYIWDLNPNVNSSDPKNIVSGNPRLQPEIAHQAEVAYGLNTGRSFFLNTAIFWKQTDNAIVEYMRTDAQGVSYTSKQNLAANKQFGLNLSTTAHFSDRWTANGNVNVNHFDYNSAALAIFRAGWATDININSTYKFPHDLSAQAFGEYSTRQVTLLGTLGNLYHYSMAVKKEIKTARMTVTLATVNPFTRYVAQTDAGQRPTFISLVEHRYYSRAVKLTVGWEFGRTAKQPKQRTKIDNSDINVQGKG